MPPRVASARRDHPTAPALIGSVRFPDARRGEPRRAASAFAPPPASARPVGAPRPPAAAWRPPDAQRHDGSPARPRAPGGEYDAGRGVLPGTKRGDSARRRSREARQAGHPRERRRRRPEGVLARLSYAKVVATLALFVALGGTATGATLARDSVGAPQIKTDAVRSPEIQADAVRSLEIRGDAVRSSEIQDGCALEIQDDAVHPSEIQDDAVRPGDQADAIRSSEIQDESIRLADIAPDAETALEARVRLATTENEYVPTCTLALTSCPNLLSVVLPADNWLVQAKFTMRNNGNPAIQGATCGLVQDSATTLDECTSRGWTCAARSAAPTPPR